MREQREPWLKLPDKDPGRDESPRADRRFRTHIVTNRGTSPAPASLSTPTPAPNPRRPGEIVQEPIPPGHVVRASPTPPAIERAAASAISRPAAPRLTQALPTEPTMPEATHAPSAAEVGLDDLAAVSSADWLAKVGEAAKMVDVVVVFYSAACLGSAMFQRAYRTVVNEMLPQLGRPYAVYRFSLDAEPGFVAEMAESLGLGDGNPITSAGFSWSGPGRRPFLIGDRAFESQALFQRILRQNLTGERTPFIGESGAKHPRTRQFETPPAAYSRAPLWGGRALVILGWCLFATAALGAAVVGMAPQWATSLLHSTSLPGTDSITDRPPAADSTQSVAIPPAASPAEPASEPLTDATKGSSKPVKPIRHAKRKYTPSRLSLNPGYWGLPEREPR
ncbi:MAG TPA: hypothetical protein VKU84_19435 [Stellaceae bacterium]|nr:hypothetical protein [Stellaceae bacterium]